MAVQMTKQRMLLFLIGSIAVLLLTKFYIDGTLRSSLTHFVMPNDNRTNCNAASPVIAVTPTTADCSPQRKENTVPGDKELAGLNENALKEIYWWYTNNIQTVCQDVRRVGSYNDGGKEVCCDEKFLPKKPCLVYSFGIDKQWDFDEDARDLFGCEVHCFDPRIKKKDHKHSDNIWFHNLGIGGSDTVNSKNWTIKTLSTIRKELGHEHTTLDILKIDVEGMEWETFRQAIDTGTLVDVKQILVEIHPNENYVMYLTVLRDLYDLGYRIFMRERNMAAHGRYRWTRHSTFRPSLMEIALFKSK